MKPGKHHGKKEGKMFVCTDCATFQFNGDYSGTDWSAETAKTIALTLMGYVISIEDDPEFVMGSCLGCGERGIDAYPAGYYDHDGELVTN